MAGGPGANLPCDSEKAKGSPGLWSLRNEKGRNAENSRVWAAAPLPPRVHTPCLSKTQGGSMGCGRRKPWLHVPATSLPGWLVMTLYEPFNLSKPSSRSVTGIKLELS